MLPGLTPVYAFKMLLSSRFQSLSRDATWSDATIASARRNPSSSNPSVGMLPGLTGANMRANEQMFVFQSLSRDATWSDLRRDAVWQYQC